MERRISALPHRLQVCIFPLAFPRAMGELGYEFRRGGRRSDWRRSGALGVRLTSISLVTVACNFARYRSIFTGSSSITIFLEMFRTLVKSNTLSPVQGRQLIPRRIRT